jgi:hypothetical protein
MYLVRGTYGFEDAEVMDEFGPRRFIGGAAISTKRAAPSFWTLSVSGFMGPPRL